MEKLLNKVLNKAPEPKEKVVEVGVSTICSYPHCKLPEKCIHELTVTNEENSKAQLPFCWMHYYIVSGNHFACKKVEGFKFVLTGNFELVEIIEQVIAAIQMTAEIKRRENLKSK